MGVRDEASQRRFAASASQSLALVLRTTRKGHDRRRNDHTRGFKQLVERQWTKDSVKELLIKDLLKRAYGKDSTEKATANEITAVYDSINKHTSTHWGIHVPFPSEEEVMRSKPFINIHNTRHNARLLCVL